MLLEIMKSIIATLILIVVPSIASVQVAKVLS
jgi:hypothetical protein